MSPGSPRTLTTSPQMALFHRFLARWSAFWVPRPSGRLLDGGNCTTRGCDTPATHRQRASCSAKPPPLPVSSALQGPRARMGHRWVAETRQLHTRKVPRRNKTLPARAARPHFRYKPLPARAARPHFRYKTLPARPKWLDLALFLHAGRVLYRCHHQEAEQGEFCTEHEAELWLANRTPGPTCVEGTGGTGVEGVGGTGVEGTGGLRGTEPGQCRWAVARPIHGAGGRRQDPAQTNFARNFRRSFFETAQKRCNSNEVISMFEQVTRELRAKLLRRRQDHAQPNVACNSPTTRTNTNSKTAEYQRLDFNT